MKTILSIEGFDRVGKDTLLDTISNPLFSQIYGKDEKVEKVVASIVGIVPDYRDKLAMASYLEAVYSDEFNRILNSEESMFVMGRFFASDYVFSKLFHRKKVARKFRRLFKKNNLFVDEVIILWSSYDEYLKRCKKIGEEPEYSKNEFDHINALFYRYYHLRRMINKHTAPILVSINENTIDFSDMHAVAEFLQKLYLNKLMQFL